MDERSLQQLGRKRVLIAVRYIVGAALVALLLAGAFLLFLPLLVTPRGGSHTISPGSHERNQRLNQRLREASAELSVGNLGRAEELYKRIIEEHGYSSGINQQLAKMYEDQGRKAEALEQYAAILNPPPKTWSNLSESPEILGRTMELATELGRADLAEQALGNVLRTGLGKPVFSDLPAPVTAEEKLAAAHLIIGIRSYGEKDEEALRHYAAATELAPTQPKAWFFKGQALRALGRFAEARQALEKARQTEPPGTKQAESIEQELWGIPPEGAVFADRRRVVGGRLVAPP